MLPEESTIDNFDMEASPAFGMLPDAGEFVITARLKTPSFEGGAGWR